MQFINTPAPCPPLSFVERCVEATQKETECKIEELQIVFAEILKSENFCKTESAASSSTGSSSIWITPLQRSQLFRQRMIWCQTNLRPSRGSWVSFLHKWERKCQVDFKEILVCDLLKAHWSPRFTVGVQVCLWGNGRNRKKPKISPEAAVLSSPPSCKICLEFAVRVVSWRKNPGSSRKS